MGRHVDIPHNEERAPYLLLKIFTCLQEKKNKDKQVRYDHCRTTYNEFAPHEVMLDGGDVTGGVFSG